MKKRYKDFLALTKSRKSTYEFSNKKVKGSYIKSILEAGRWAPSCNNIQPWHFIVVKDKTRISMLMKTAYYGEFHEDPPLIIALILDSSRCYKGKNMCLREITTGIAEGNMCIAMSALNMILESHYLSIDSCILSPEPKKAKEILKMRKEDVPLLLLGFGYERKNAFHKIRERRKIKESLSYEYYSRRKK